MYLVFDTETTGFPHWSQPFDYPIQSRICQIACILLDEEYKEIGAFHSLIKPDGWLITPGAEQAHGITQEECERHGIQIEYALGVITQFMDIADCVVCHGIRFDGFMLDVELQHAGLARYNLEEQGICTMKASRKICELRNIKKRGPGLNLKELVKECLGEEMTNAHDAMADVQSTAKCFSWLVMNGYILISKNDNKELTA